MQKSGRRGSNSRHSAWKAEALPTELRPLNISKYTTKDFFLQQENQRIYIANSAQNFQNNVILSVSEVSEQKRFFGLKP